MDLFLRCFLIVLSMIVFAVVMKMLLKKKFSESDMIFWFFVSVICLTLGFIPQLLNRLAAFIGIDYPPSALFLFSTLFMFSMNLKLNSRIAMLESKVKELTMQVCILEKTLEPLSKELTLEKQKLELLLEQQTDTFNQS